MDLNNKNIMFACCYEAQYGGNFIKMLEALASSLRQKYQTQIYFVFPKQSDKEWLKELSEKYTVGFTCKPYSKSTTDILNLIEKWNIDLVHTHFEGYDIPVAKAVKKVGKDIKMVWHLHDYLSLDKTGMNFKLIRKVGTNLRLWRHYGWYGRNAYFVGVSSEVTNIAIHYRHHIFSFPKVMTNEQLYSMEYPNASVLLNGIDLQRISSDYKRPAGVFTFLTFGGESYSKGIPCLLDAAETLVSKGLCFRLMITEGYTTKNLVDERYGNKIPDWLKIVRQTDNVASLFNKAHCYVSASLKETMSMGIAEASLFGLPIIQSDIPGTWWNSDTPSAFLFRLNDANDLAIKMMQVMDMPVEDLKELCSKSQAINRERLSMERWSNKVVKIFEKL